MSWHKQKTWPICFYFVDMLLNQAFRAMVAFRSERGHSLCSFSLQTFRLQSYWSYSQVSMSSASYCWPKKQTIKGCLQKEPHPKWPVLQVKWPVLQVCCSVAVSQPVALLRSVRHFLGVPPLAFYIVRAWRSRDSISMVSVSRDKFSSLRALVPKGLRCVDSSCRLEQHHP